MNALEIVAVFVGGAFGYAMAAVYVYMRLVWHFRQHNRYSSEESAFFSALLLPVGLCVLVVYSLGAVDRDGLPPRAVRRDRKLKQQKARIAELERELDIR